MPDESTDQTTGRTPWDFATAVLMRLVPTTVVVLGLLGFAYFLYSEISKAQLEANQQLQNSLASVQEQLAENTKKMGDMSATLIENITKILELNKQVDKEIKAAWAEVEAAKRELVRAQADAELGWQQAEIRKEAVTDQAFQDRMDLRQAIDGLDAAAAKALIPKIVNEFPPIIPFVAIQYPDSVRDADHDGKKAKKLLRRLVSLTAKEPEDRNKWKAASAFLAAALAVTGVHASEIPPNGNPVDWACKGTLMPVSPDKIKAWCQAHPKGQRGQPFRLGLAPATLSDLPAKNRYDLALGEWLESGAYAKAVKDGGYGWVRDKNWRLTGPIVGRLCKDKKQKDKKQEECNDTYTKGYVDGDSESYGVHPGVRIYYSPEVIDWLCDDRKGVLPDGAMMIKEMSPIGGLPVETDAKACMTVTEDPPVTAWTAWVRANSVAHDGWYWVGNTGAGNPPIFDRSAATDKEFARPPPIVPNPEWYPTGDSPIPDVVYPSNMFGPYCLNCHASAKIESTFASLDNVLGPGIEYKLYHPTETRLLAELGDARSLHTESEPSEADGRAPFATPLPAPTEQFLSFYDQIEPPVSFSQAWDLRLPAETFDHVFSSAAGPGQFLTSDQCVGCHDATYSNAATPNMIFTETDDKKNKTLINLSPYGTWRVSPMGLAGRDPIFFSQLQSETNHLPQYAACIENTCLHCHGVMGQRQLAFDTQGPIGDECKKLFPVAPPSQVPFGEPFRLSMVTQYQRGKESPQPEYGNLARDGISCTVCHHIANEELGKEATYTGNFIAGPRDVVYGPYKDDKIVPKPMKHALGVTPKFGAQTTESAMCNTCHNILLPVFTNEGKQIKASYEQTTGLEWQNSDFNPESDSPKEDWKSCQDCHMRTAYKGTRLKFKIANIESADFAPTTERLPDKDIKLTVRDRFARHTLAGLNVFLNEMFQQFPLILGLRQIDYMTGSGVRAPLIHGRNAIVEIAKEATAKIAIDPLEKTSEGKLKTVVTVTNLGGHYLPSGVGFRRVFIEFLVKDKDGKTLWASGRTNALGVIVAGLTDEPLKSEQPVKYPKTYQPHYSHAQKDTPLTPITRGDQVQIYQELIKDSAGNFTTSGVTQRF